MELDQMELQARRQRWGSEFLLFLFLAAALGAIGLWGAWLARPQPAEVAEGTQRLTGLAARLGAGLATLPEATLRYLFLACSLTLVFLAIDIALVAFRVHRLRPPKLGTGFFRAVKRILSYMVLERPLHGAACLLIGASSTGVVLFVQHIQVADCDETVECEPLKRLLSLVEEIPQRPWEGRVVAECRHEQDELRAELSKETLLELQSLLEETVRGSVQPPPSPDIRRLADRTARLQRSLAEHDRARIESDREQVLRERNQAMLLLNELASQAGLFRDEAHQTGELLSKLQASQEQTLKAARLQYEGGPASQQPGVWERFHRAFGLRREDEIRTVLLPICKDPLLWNRARASCEGLGMPQPVNPAEAGGESEIADDSDSPSEPDGGSEPPALSQLGAPL